MIYDHNLTLVVPLLSLGIAKAINRHLDSDDVGGAEGFIQRVTDGTTVFAAYSRPCDNEYAAVNPTAAGLALLDDADSAAQRVTLGVVIGTDVQAYDADTAFIDQSQVWTGAPKTSVQADNDLSFDISVKKDFTCTPTALGTLNVLAKTEEEVAKQKLAKAAQEAQRFLISTDYLFAVDRFKTLLAEEPERATQLALDREAARETIRLDRAK